MYYKLIQGYVRHVLQVNLGVCSACITIQAYVRHVLQVSSGVCSCMYYNLVLGYVHVCITS